MHNTSPQEMPMMLQEKTEFTLDGRAARVAQARSSECLIIWDEWTDPHTGEVFPIKSDMISSFEIGKMLADNRLRITARPEGGEKIEQAVTRLRTKEEHTRAFWRLTHVEAAEEMIAESLMGQTRAEFESHIDAINGKASIKQTQRAKKQAGRTKAGFKYESMAPPVSGASIYRWRKRYQKDGVRGLYDRQSESGNTGIRYNVEEIEFARDVIATRLNEERADIQSVVNSVQAAIRVENLKRSNTPELGSPLKVMGHHKIWNLIAQTAPVDHAIRTKGMDVAYKDLHCLGLGLQLSFALERVELDVYDCDLMVFLDAVGVLGHLTQAEKLSLGLDGTPQRVKISAAIDVYTGCILAFQIATSDTTDLALRTVEMIYLDKQPLADAVGALSPWNMRGHPVVLAIDRGNSYIGDDFYLRLAAAGITNLGVPAGAPFLKPWIESWFRGVGAGFLQRFTGRTFGNVVKKGENDAQARATLTLDDFLFWLSRWIVDAYHNTAPRTLGKRAPRLAWDAAVSETPPYALVDDDQLRVAFGVPVFRKLTRQGLRVGNLFYWSEELISYFLRGPWVKDKELKIYWWAAKIDAITVELSDGSTVQAQCIDPKWHGKSHDDVLVYMAEAATLDDLAVEARDKAIVEIDAFSHGKAKLAGLIPHQPSTSDLDYLEKKFSRHIDIPSRRLDGMMDIFGDEVIPETKRVVTPEQEKPQEPKAINTPDVDLGDDEDLME